MKYFEFKQKIKHFPIFSTSMLHTLTPEVDTLKTQLSLWKKKGLIRPLRKGLYVLNPGEREVEPSHFYLANQMFIPSYVSLESALAYYGLIPEYVAATTSVTARKTCRFENEFGLFTYQHVLRSGYGGFQSIQDAGRFSVLMATPEKAIVDFLYLNLSTFSLSDRRVFRASYRFQNCGRLSPKKMKAHAQRFGVKKLISITNLFMDELCR